MSYITTLLFLIANGFLVPVIVGLLYFFFRSLFLIGSFVSTYLQRIRQHKLLADRFTEIAPNQIRSYFKEGEDLPATSYVTTARKILTCENTPSIERELGLYEVQSEKELGSARMLVKFGPILGLMGTLIPMGPALAGLSSGDVSTMAYNMQVAFSTTVLGLFCGTVGFVLLQVKQRWMHEDQVNLDYLADCLEEQFESPKKEEKA